MASASLAPAWRASRGRPRRTGRGRRRRSRPCPRPIGRLPESRPLVVACRIMLPPQHVLAWVVVHLALLLYVKDATGNRERLFRQRFSQLIKRPRPVVAIVAELHVRVLRCVEGALRLVR